MSAWDGRYAPDLPLRHFVLGRPQPRPTVELVNVEARNISNINLSSFSVRVTLQVVGAH
jgi:hypothetical protein